MKIGVDLGGTHIAVGMVDDNGSIISKKEKDFTSDEKENIENTILENIVKFSKSLVDKNNIELIGIAAPGTCENGVIVQCNKLKMKNFNLRKELNEKINNINVEVTNDATCAALCEKKYGAMKEYSDCLFLCLGTGVGGAVFLDNKLLKPKRHPGFELGHVVIERKGKKCNCGRNGCFETYASMKNLKEEIAKKEGLSSITGKELYDILKNNYDEVGKIVEGFIENLSIGLINYINIFEPEIICIGGSFAYYKDILLDKLVEKINQDNANFNNEIPKITTAYFKNDAGIIGATLQ